MRVLRRTQRAEIRKILVGMIIDPTVLGRVATVWRPEGLFDSPAANTMAGWCIKHWERYKRPPGRDIESSYVEWLERQQKEDSAEARLMESTLASLSAEYERDDEFSTDHVLDVAGNHFNKVALLRLAEEVQDEVNAGNMEGAEKVRMDFRPVEIGVKSGVDVLRDRAALQSALDHSQEGLVHFGGKLEALGEFFGECFHRDSFVAFLGAEKRRKSWWLYTVAFEAVKQRRRVAVFECGDLSERQALARFAIRVAVAPAWPKTIRYPVKFVDDDDVMVEHEDRNFKHKLQVAKVLDRSRLLYRSYIRSKDTHLKLCAHPSDTLSAEGIMSQLESWKNEGWIPDVVVIDYADLLAPPPGIRDGRDQINKTWKQLRAISQIYHCCLVTATQADAASYKARWLGRWNFSEDKRKLAHVTAMVGLNMTEEEGAQDVMRLNWIDIREPSSFRQKYLKVMVAGCLDIGRPAIISKILKFDDSE